MKYRLTALVVFATLAGLGCQTATGPASHAAAASPQRAVIVAGGNGGHTLVFLPSKDAAHPTMLSTSGAPTCADCESAAAKYFQGGVLEPKCPTCGATRTATTAFPQHYGHN